MRVHVYACLCVCTCLCMCACVNALGMHVRLFVRAHACAYVCVRARARVQANVFVRIKAVSHLQPRAPWQACYGLLHLRGLKGAWPGGCGGMHVHRHAVLRPQDLRVHASVQCSVNGGPRRAQCRWKRKESAVQVGASRV